MSDVNHNTAAIDDIDDEAVSLFAKMHESPDSKDSDIDADKQEQAPGDDASEPEGDDTASNSQGQAEEDPWLSVPEALRNEHLALKQNAQKLEADHRANAGRVAALNRKTQELQQQLAAREKATGKEGSGDMPTAADLKGKTFDELKAEWPEVAQALLDSQAQTQQLIQRELEPLRQMRQQQEQQQQEQFIQSELDRLAQQHPDFKEIAADPAFSQWVSTQPAGVQAMYGSISADDNAALLTLFKTATGRATKPAVSVKSSLSDHAAIPRKGAGRAALDPNSLDPVELFNRLSANKK
ncbi:MAG TPA: hypothetical protein DF774_02205 [Rheinheimera sp.]|uniref:hypothetical protein n=1 Tax=Rheinheimera sp. TaxID=1869214 RepID=UPI000EE42549|nr:hypothetical protein [Rheinheimera sp.]HCU64553.1 hypothetical protein [Rheinheimera sp.]